MTEKLIDLLRRSLVPMGADVNFDYAPLRHEIVAAINEHARRADAREAAPTKSSRFSEFIRNASPEGKERIHKTVMDAVPEEQNKVIEAARKAEAAPDAQPMDP
jgi:hypothetical protein